MHIVLDNAATHKTPEVHKRLVKHTRFIFHSRSHLAALGMNLAQRWFAELSTKWLHRGVHTPVDHLIEPREHPGQNPTTTNPGLLYGRNPQTTSSKTQPDI